MNYEENWLLTRISVSTTFMSKFFSLGSFYAIYFLIEYSFGTSLAVVFAVYPMELSSSGVTDTLVSVALLLAILVLWMHLPILMRPEYDKITEVNIIPRSLEIHLFSLLFLTPLIFLLTKVMSIHYGDLLLLEISYWSTLLVSVVLLGMILLVYTEMKDLYFDMLFQEVEAVEEDT